MELNIDIETSENEAYRNVIYTDANCQVVLMSLYPGEEIGVEKHSATSQFIKVEDGIGRAMINGQEYNLSEGVAVVIPPNTWHNIIASPDSWLKLYTIYSGKILHDSDAYEVEKGEKVE